MAGEEHFEMLDLSRLDIRVRTILRRMGVETIGQLLELNERDFMALKDCGAKTAAKILQLQAEYGKDLTPQKDRETIDKAVESSRGYMNRLIVVAIAANEVVKSGQRCKNNRYYFRVTTKYFNVLKRALEALRETKI